MPISIIIGTRATRQQVAEAIGYDTGYVVPDGNTLSILYPGSHDDFVEAMQGITHTLFASQDSQATDDTDENGPVYLPAETQQEVRQKELRIRARMEQQAKNKAKRSIREFRSKQAEYRARVDQFKKRKDRVDADTEMSAEDKTRNTAAIDKRIAYWEERLQLLTDRWATFKNNVTQVENEEIEEANTFVYEGRKENEVRSRSVTQHVPFDRKVWNEIPDRIITDDDGNPTGTEPVTGLHSFAGHERFPDR